MEVFPLDNWRMSVFNEYGDSTDPDEHVRMFMNQMTLYTMSNFVWCKAFSILLEGESLA